VQSSDTTLKDINECQPIDLLFHRLIWLKFSAAELHIMPLTNYELRKNFAVKVIIYIMAYTKFCMWIPYFSTDLAAIWNYKVYITALSNNEFHENWCSEVHPLHTGNIYFTPIFSPFFILFGYNSVHKPLEHVSPENQLSRSHNLHKDVKGLQILLSHI